MRRDSASPKRLPKRSDLPAAARESSRLADLMPDRPDLQITAGKFLAMSGRFEEAKVRARSGAGEESAPTWKRCFSWATRCSGFTIRLVHSLSWKRRPSSIPLRVASRPTSACCRWP